MHPRFGFMSARLQTWFPFQVQIYLNGREWLEQQMKEAGVAYIRQQNCFPWVADYGRAQSLMDEQLRTDWPKELGAVAQQLNPLHGKMFKGFRPSITGRWQRANGPRTWVFGAEWN